MGTPETLPLGDGNPVAEGDSKAPIVEAIEAEVAAAQPEVEQLVADATRADQIAAGEVNADPDPPVYDERGNVRPRGTEGARPMTKAERKAIAKRLAAEPIVDDRTTPYATPPETNPKQKGRAR